MKNILILNGSPRKNGNSETMLNSFIEIAEKNNKIVKFDIVNKKIESCLACEKCYSSDKACVIDDDFNIIANEVLNADVVVFSAPVYWYSIPGKIKNVLDRFFSFVVGEKDVAQKELYVISCCEEDNMSVFDGFTMPLKKSANLLKWTYGGDVLVPNVLNIGDINNTNGCELARKLAEQI